MINWTVEGLLTKIKSNKMLNVLQDIKIGKKMYRYLDISLIPIYIL